MLVGPAWIRLPVSLSCAGDRCERRQDAREWMVSQERTEAVVLRGVDFSETSRIVTFLSPDRGRLACMAKGARRKKSPFMGLLDTFNRLELVYYWKDGRAVQPLGEGSLLDGYPGLKGDLDRVTYGAFPLEVAYKAAHENEPSHALFEVLVRGLEGLDRWQGDARTHCCWQVFGLLSAAGFEPALDACIECGASVSASPSFSYSGGVACRNCPSDRKLTAVEYATLRALAEGVDACPPLKAGKTIFGVLRDFAARQLESDFRSVRVIEQMFR